MRRKKNDWVSLLAALILLGLIVLLKSGLLDNVVQSLPLGNLQIILYPLIIVFITVLVARFVSVAMHHAFERASRRLKVDGRTRYALFAKLVTLIIYIIGFGVAGSFIPQLRNLSVSLFASAGLLAIIIGFATQKTLGNLVSGLMLVVYQPYRIGDRIKFGEEYGTIEDISLRHTVIRTWDNRRIIVPNSKMDEEVINNYTIVDEKMRGWFDVGISYDSDIDLARKLIIEEVKAHPNFIDNRSAADIVAEKDPVTVRVVAHDNSAVRLRVYYWAADQSKNWQMKTDLLEQIKKRFDKEGVEIPYPYHTLVYKKELPKPKRLKQTERLKHVTQSKKRRKKIAL